MVAALGAAALALAALGGCSRDEKKPSGPSGDGRLVVAVTVDWEGANLSDENLEALSRLRSELPDAPLTHFLCPAYFTRAAGSASAGETIREAVREGDEVAIHLHAWSSLARAAGVEVPEGPSFLTGKKLVTSTESDSGYDRDLEVFTVAALRELIRTSGELLEREAGLEPSSSFRAGGYLGTPKVLQAIRAEGLSVDSSAIDHRWLAAAEVGDFFAERVEGVWPQIDSGSQPFAIGTPAGEVLEVPVSAVADYASSGQMVSLARARIKELEERPDRHVFLSLGLHQETAAEHWTVLRDALVELRKEEELAPYLEFATIEEAAELARE